MILASIQTLKRNGKESETEKVFRLVLESLEISASRATTNGSSVAQASSVMQVTSVKTQHDK